MSSNFMAITEPKTTSDTEFALCDCCGMTEEYTAVYIQNVRAVYAGKLICGLCSEAVNYEIFRCGKKQRRIALDEALAIHMKLCSEFVASPSPTIDFISVIGEMFRRRILEFPIQPPSSESILAVDGGAICAAAVIAGTGSCLPALSGGA